MLLLDAVPESVKSLLLRLAPHRAIQDFALGGGTSLALRFGHRLSVDLGFFTIREFAPEALFDELNLVDATVIGRARNSLTMDAGGVKLDLMRHACRLLEPAESIGGITLLSLPDVVTMKLNAIANRGSKKDFFDFVELLDHFPIKSMIGFFTEKYPTTDAFTVIRSLAWFEEAEDEPDPVSLGGRNWEQVKQMTRATVAGL